MFISTVKFLISLASNQLCASVDSGIKKKAAVRGEGRFGNMPAMRSDESYSTLGLGTFWDEDKENPSRHPQGAFAFPMSPEGVRDIQRGEAFRGEWMVGKAWS